MQKTAKNCTGMKFMSSYNKGQSMKNHEEKIGFYNFHG